MQSRLTSGLSRSHRRSVGPSLNPCCRKRRTAATKSKKSKACERRLEPCSPNGCRRRTEHLVDWAATLRKEAQRSPILRSDDIARRYGIVESAVGNALRRQERRGLVEHV